MLISRTCPSKLKMSYSGDTTTVVFLLSNFIYSLKKITSGSQRDIMEVIPFGKDFLRKVHANTLKRMTWGQSESRHLKRVAIAVPAKPFVLVRILLQSRSLRRYQWLKFQKLSCLCLINLLD